MVRTTVDSNPLDPTYAQKRTSIDGSEKKNISTRRMSDLESIVKDSQNVAPSSQAICAELAHEHAIEDLHQITDHVSDDNNPARGPFFPQIYPQHTTEPKLDE
ncbi:hypothetical protein PENSTE_c027G01134 [Penicillium steckii]|uniref:Uncharacterized protein n=1 Tax=Penicillium steckii TaxID=303698 RepID=A0A1V6SPS4_9EURO|nr:hypothetical protein PENSTE_c027G01134 [Penicillium steckii]